MSQKIIKASISHSIDILEYIWILTKQKKLCTEIDIHSFFEKTRMYTKKSLEFLLFFNILYVDKGFYHIDKEIIPEIDGSRQNIFSILKKTIIRFKPFLEFYYYKSIGKNDISAAKIVKKLYDLDDEPDSLTNIFESWNKYFEIGKTGQKPKLEEDLSHLIKSLDDEVLIHKFLKDILGDNYRFVSNKVIEDFILSLQGYSTNPSSAINDAGRALEDFLRLDFAETIDLSNCNGLGQIASDLNKHTLSHKKHNNILQGLASIRTMGDAHGVDKLSKQRWVINQSSALGYILNCLFLINSLLEYKIHNHLSY